MIFEGTRVMENAARLILQFIGLIPAESLILTAVFGSDLKHSLQNFTSTV